MMTFPQVSQQVFRLYQAKDIHALPIAIQAHLAWLEGLPIDSEEIWLGVMCVLMKCHAEPFNQFIWKQKPLVSLTLSEQERAISALIRFLLYGEASLSWQVQSLTWGDARFQGVTFLQEAIGAQASLYQTGLRAALLAEPRLKVARSLQLYAFDKMLAADALGRFFIDLSQQKVDPQQVDGYLKAWLTHCKAPEGYRSDFFKHQTLPYLVFIEAAFRELLKVNWPVWFKQLTAQGIVTLMDRLKEHSPRSLAVMQLTQKNFPPADEEDEDGTGTQAWKMAHAVCLFFKFHLFEQGDLDNGLSIWSLLGLSDVELLRYAQAVFSEWTKTSSDIFEQKLTEPALGATKSLVFV